MSQVPFHKYAFFKGEFVPFADANVSVATRGLQYGMAWFGGMRGYKNATDTAINVFRLQDHVDRFFGSARIMGTNLNLTKQEFKNAVIELLQKNKVTGDVYVRPFAYADTLDLTPKIEKDKPFQVAIYSFNLGDYISTSNGNKVCISSWVRPSDNAIPSAAKISGAYANAALARAEAANCGCDEAIMLNEQGFLAEATSMNVFLVRGGVIYTPHSGSQILPGITRKTVIELATSMGYEVQECNLTRSDAYSADEVFFTGTGAQVAWVQTIDGRQISASIGPVTAALQKEFFAVVRGQNAKYKKYLTEIKI